MHMHPHKHSIFCAKNKIYKHNKFSISNYIKEKQTRKENISYTCSLLKANFTGIFFLIFVFSRIRTSNLYYKHIY